MKCGLVVLFLVGLCTIFAMPTAAQNPSEPSPLLTMHGLLAIEQPELTLRAKRATLKQRLAHLPHPSITQLNKFNTVGGAAMLVFQVYWDLRNWHIVP